ncbi:hypothetical protein ANN_24160 [Periplaneta americana]|uniref:Tetratricopeptide repeat protein 7 N-terminal domain-containing protein n=1 Tax=Periplaneta americana TaxID=6978 RepID=A0ABQ8S2L4_PERAM|nr:hypothetical protein ANN_24160 [Periplaneta americana]
MSRHPQCLLNHCEAMAVRDAVLSQSPEFKEARIHAYDNATAIYDLLTIALVRWGHADLLHESFERAMKFSFEEPHVWMQHALCLVTMGQYAHALTVLKEVTRLLPTKVIPCLLAARICYEQLNQVAEGLEWSNKALNREISSPQSLLSRCHLYLGIGYNLQAAANHLKQEKQHLVNSAFDAFHKIFLLHNTKKKATCIAQSAKALACRSGVALRAQQTDPNDHLAEYYLALQFAYGCQVGEAMSHVKMALNLRAEHVPSLHLLILLLSAQKQHAEALQLVEAALEEYPDNLNLLYVKAHLELHSIGGEVTSMESQCSSYSANGAPSAMKIIIVFVMVSDNNGDSGGDVVWHDGDGDNDSCASRKSRLVPVAWQQWSEMEALIPSPAACEVRSVIKFFNAQSIAPVEIHRQLCQVNGPIMSKQVVRCWCRQFSEGRQSVHDEERSGRPSLINDDRVELVRQCIMDNRRFTITELSSHFPQISRYLLH